MESDALGVRPEPYLVLSISASESKRSYSLGLTETKMPVTKGNWVAAPRGRLRALCLEPRGLPRLSPSSCSCSVILVIESHENLIKR